MNPKSNQAPVAQDATAFRALEEGRDDMEHINKSNNGELVQNIGSIQEV